MDPIELSRSFNHGPNWSGQVFAVIVLRTPVCHVFDTEAAGASYATSFIVDKRRGIILTNRHVVKPGPVVAEAIFVNREEILVYPIYRDPVHDFGFFCYDPSAVQFLVILSSSSSRSFSKHLTCKENEQRRNRGRKKFKTPCSKLNRRAAALRCPERPHFNSVLRGKSGLVWQGSGFDAETVANLSEKQMMSIASDYGIEISRIRGVVDNSNRILESQVQM
ncbi:hypothetical protein ACFXTH_000336 [Malus domestica]